MKNYDELTNDLLERRDRYVADQKKKRKSLMSVATSLCCLCLVALLGFGMWQGGMFNTTPPDQTLEDALYPGIKDNFDESKGESADNPAANNRIVINTINGISADRMNIKPWEDERSGIYKRDGGTGEVYWDTDILNYSNEDFTRSVHVEVDKGSYVLKDYLFFNGTEEKSVINNFEVFIGLSENGYYYSEFMYNGIGFLIDAEGVTEEEFVAIIASIIK